MLVASGLLALAAVGCGGETESSAPAPAPPASENPIQPPAVPAPEVEGVTIDGERLSLASFRGKPVFVNVWAAW